jgi:hypothetical protein
MPFRLGDIDELVIVFGWLQLVIVAVDTVDCGFNTRGSV